MTDNKSQKQFSIKIFECVCLATIVCVGVLTVQRMIGQSSAIADQAVQSAVDQAEEVITEKVDEHVDSLLEEGMNLAKVILSEQGSTEDGPLNEVGKSKKLPVDRIDHIFRNGTKIFGKITDEVIGLSSQEEIQVGKHVHEIVRSQHRIIDDTFLLNRIEELAQPFLGYLNRPEMTYRFYVIDDDAINAFAHVGGYVYVNRGLLERTEGDEDALQFVIGHEVAHSDLRHCAASMTATVRADEVLPGSGTLAALAYRAIALGYSEDQELESDLWSYQIMRRSGKNHFQSIQGLEMLKDEFGVEQESDSRPQRSPMDYIDAHFRTHPPIQKRLLQLEQERFRTAD